MTEPIKCHAVVYKVQSLVDHGMRITLDLPETEIMQMAMFAECQRMQVVLDIEATPQIANNSQPDTADGKKSRDNVKSLRGE